MEHHGFSTVDFKVISCIDYTVSKLLEAIDYVAIDGTRYRIPKYQSTDFASIPKALWGPPLFLIPTGFWSLPTIAHDAMYRNTMLTVDSDGTMRTANLLRQQCDDLCLEMMHSIVPQASLFEKAQMEAIFHGLVFGGWHAFREDRC